MGAGGGEAMVNGEDMGAGGEATTGAQDMAGNHGYQDH